MGSTGDVLVQVRNENISAYLESAAKYLPKYLRAWRFLDTHIAMQKKSKVINGIDPRCSNTIFTVYNCPIEYCIFVAISDSKTVGEYTIFASAPEEYTEILNDALMKTKLIDWKSNPLIVSIPKPHFDTINRMTKVHAVAKQFFIENHIYRLPQEKALQFEYSVPSGLVVKYLAESDAKLINDVWPHRYDGSENFIRSNIALNWGIGLYRESDNQLLSWAIKNEIGALGFFQTLSTEQGKGYGKLIMKAFCKMQAEKEPGDILAYVIVINDSSNYVFNKCGFEVIERCAWSL